MKQFNQSFYIYKTSYIKDKLPDMGFIPMLMRRKLSTVGKAALAVMHDIYENNDIKLVYASNYGEIVRVKKLLAQKDFEGEISPTGFSFSVHNSTVGLFSLLNKINSSYNSISAGENSLCAGILESILTEEDVLFCFAESIPELKSLAMTIGKTPRKDALHIELLPADKEESDPSFEAFIDFIEGKNDEFSCGYYKLRKVK